MIEKRTVLIKI